MGRAKVLVVDDERDTVAAVGDLLEALLPIKTLPAYSAAMARHQIQKHAPETVVALVDHVMPGESGLHLIQDLRDRYPGIMFILMTALFRLEEEPEGPVMFKPLDPDDLVATVAGTLEGAQPRQPGQGVEGLPAWLRLPPARGSAHQLR